MQFKDFLQLYNEMTEMCFQRCVVNINVRKLDAEEISCVDSCVEKFITYNNKLMQNFVRAQSVLLNKRIADAEQQQISTELQSKELDPS